MPKLKTNKAVSKRFHKTKPKSKKSKILQRTCGQDHFNSREKSKITRKKRRDHTISKANEKTIKLLTPYS